MFLLVQSHPINYKYWDTAILSTFRIHQKSPHAFPLSTVHSSNIRERWWGITGWRSTVKPTYAEQELWYIVSIQRWALCRQATRQICQTDMNDIFVNIHLPWSCRRHISTSLCCEIHNHTSWSHSLHMFLPTKQNYSWPSMQLSQSRRSYLEFEHNLMALCKGMTAVTPVRFAGRQHYWVLRYLVTCTYRQQLSLCVALY